MINPHKRISPFEIEQFINGNNAILTLVFDDKTVVQDVIEKFKDEILGLNLKIKGNLFVEKKREEIKVHKLPRSSSFDSIQTLTKWAAFKYPPKLYRELGTISANDNTIILNINHAVCDGRYITGICRHISSISQKPSNHLPSTFDDEFSQEIQERSKSPPKFYRNDKNNTIFSNYGMKKSENEFLYDGIFDAHTMSCYNNKSKEYSNLAAAIVTGYSLSVSALDGKDEIHHIGGSMVENMRNVLRYKKLHNIENLLKKRDNTENISQEFKNKVDPINIKHANFFTVVPFTTEVSGDTKISECYDRLNNCREKQFRTNLADLFDYRNSIEFTNPKNIDNGIMLCFNNLGPIPVVDPVKDVYLYNQFFHSALSLAIPLLTYTIIDEKRRRDEFHSQVRYQCNGLTEKQVRILSKSLKLYLQAIDTCNTVSEIYNELKEFQKSLL